MWNTLLDLVLICVAFVVLIEREYYWPNDKLYYWPNSARCCVAVAICCVVRLLFDITPDMWFVEWICKPMFALVLYEFTKRKSLLTWMEGQQPIETDTRWLDSIVTMPKKMCQTMRWYTSKKKAEHALFFFLKYGVREDLHHLRRALGWDGYACFGLHD